MPRWSPDGKRLAFISEARRAIVVVDLASGRITRATAQGYEPGPFAWSPDGARIAFIGSAQEQAGTHVLVCNVDGSRCWPVIQNAEHLYSEGVPPLWSPDGTKVAYLSTEGGAESRVVIARVDGSSAFRTLSDGLPLLWCYQWQSPPLSSYAREKDLPFAEVLVSKQAGDRAPKKAHPVLTVRKLPERPKSQTAKGVKRAEHYTPVANGALRAFAGAIQAGNRQGAGKYIVSFDDLQRFATAHPRLVGESRFHWLYGEKRTATELVSAYWDQMRSSWGTKCTPVNQIGPAYYCSEELLDAIQWNPYMFQGAREQIADQAASLGFSTGVGPRECVAFVVIPHSGQFVALPMLRVPGDGWKILDW